MAWLLQCRSILLSMMRIYIPEPLFSVVVPCRAGFKHTISLLSAQTWPSWELIVVMDGTTQTSSCLATLKKIQASHRALSQLQNTAVVHARQQNLADVLNTGVSRSKGEWIAVLQPRSAPDKDLLQTAEHAMTQNPRLGLIVSELRRPAEERGRNPHDSNHQFAYIYRRALWESVGEYSSASDDVESDFLQKIGALGAKGFALASQHAFDVDRAFDTRVDDFKDYVSRR